MKSRIKLQRLGRLSQQKTLSEMTDIAGYRHDFHALFGFEQPNVDYTADINPVCPFLH